MVMPPVKSRTTKALIIAVLIALSVASVVIAGSIRGDVMVNAEDSVKRYLRSHADTTGGDQTDILEERLSLLPLYVTDLTTRMSAFFQKIQLWWWRLAQKSSNDVFADLKLGTTKGILFEDPAFSEWVAFVKKRYKTPELAYDKMFQTLADHYKDDAALAKVLGEGTQIKSTRLLAEELLDIQSKRWKLNRKTWKDFDAFLKDTKENAKLSKEFEDLADYYANEAALTKTLVEGTEIEGSPVAEKMLDIQFTKWKHAGKPDNDVFALLRLGQKEGELFESPVFSKWVTFVDARYDTSELAHEKIFETLAGHYKDDAALAKVLGEGTQSESTRLLAEELLDIQFAKWATTDEGVVFALLKLGEQEAKLFESPVFLKWVAFVETRYKKVDPKLAHEMIYVTLMGHCNACMDKVLLAATKGKNSKPFAEKLEGMRKMVEEGIPMDKIFPSLMKPPQKANDLEAKSVPSG